MKRDMELMRRILLAIEASNDDEPNSIRLPRHEFDPLHIAHHIRLLQEGNLIHAVENRGTAIVPHSLTWQGHEFLNAIRDNAIWETLKRFEALAGGDLPTVMLYELAMREMRNRLGLFDEDAAAAAAQNRSSSGLNVANYVQSIHVEFGDA